jgi:hypothetical protein
MHPEHLEPSTLVRVLGLAISATIVVLSYYALRPHAPGFPLVLVALALLVAVAIAAAIAG